jgi:hypothetical protein
MRNKKSSICWLMFTATAFLLSSNLWAQTQENDTYRKSKKEKQAEKREKVNKMIRKEKERAMIFQKQWVLGYKAYNDGWALLYELGKMKNVDVTNTYGIEFGERKHAKEEKLSTVSSSGFFFGSPYVYAKQQNLLFAKFSVGQSRLLGGKGNKNGVAVSAVYSGGLSLGLLKPYYLDIRDPLDGTFKTIKYEDNGSRNDSLFLDYDAQPTSSGFFKGFGEMKFVPGLFFKGGFRFDYGRYNELISAIECGFNVEYYTQAMPIMVNVEGKKSFVGVFAAIEFGKRK